MTESDTLPAPLMTLDRVRDSMRNTKHLSKILSESRIQRHYFDPADPEDRLVYLVFSKTGRWIKQYYFEMPDTNAVAMCQRRLMEYATRNEIVKAQTIIDSLQSRINASSPTN